MTNVTITRPGKYSSGKPCFITENAAYPGIVGYGDRDYEARASFEAARASYEALTAAPPQADTAASITWLATVVAGNRQTVAAI